MASLHEYVLIRDTNLVDGTASIDGIRQTLGEPSLSV